MGQVKQGKNGKRVKNKQVRNKARDMIGDYYKTNRQISEDDRARDAETKREKRFTKGEMVMAVIIVLLVALLIFKSLVLDQVRINTEEEAQFKGYVEHLVETEYQGKLGDLGLITYKVNEITKADMDNPVEYTYKDTATGEEIHIVQSSGYTARVTGYFLWIIPVDQFLVSPAEENEIRRL